MLSHQSSFSSEEDITDTAYSDTSSDAEVTLFTTKDYSASHKKLLSAKDLMEEDETSEDDVNGYWLLNVSLLGKFVNTVSCPHCKAVGLILEEDTSMRKGLCSFLMPVCKSCGNTTGFYTSKKIFFHGSEPKVCVSSAGDRLQKGRPGNVLCHDKFTSSGSIKVIYWPRR